jgi:hypothetical protein
LFSGRVASIFRLRREAIARSAFFNNRLSGLHSGYPTRCTAPRGLRLLSRSGMAARLCCALWPVSCKDHAHCVVEATRRSTSSRHDPVTVGRSVTYSSLEARITCFSYDGAGPCERNTSSRFYCCRRCWHCLGRHALARRSRTRAIDRARARPSARATTIGSPIDANASLAYDRAEYGTQPVIGPSEVRPGWRYQGGPKSH